ncbi:MAG: SseB family protein [Elusimicrobia bacterium]|nr:SseB family protein [Elusimicrobiota bacterium]
MQVKHGCGAEFAVGEDMLGQKVPCPQCGQLADIPPMDLTRPVENPEVVGAMERFQKDQSRPNLRAMMESVMKGTYLIGANIIARGAPEGKPGQLSWTSLRKGDEIQIVTVTNDADQKLLVLFTDWRQLNAWKAGFSGLVSPAKDALGFASSNGHDGVVINPGGPSLELDREQVGLLLSGQLPPP